MPDLDPQKAAELESIIDKMVDRGESDDDIKFIVDEYKAKHLSSPKPPAPSTKGGESGAFVRPITPSTSTSASEGSESESWTKTINPLADKGAVKPTQQAQKAGVAKKPNQVESGNIDLSNRPVVDYGGKKATVLSFSIGTDKGEVLIPQVVNGKVVSKDEAIKHYEKTGEHLGIFKTIEDANRYGQELHQQEEKRVASFKPAQEKEVLYIGDKEKNVIEDFLKKLPTKDNVKSIQEEKPKTRAEKDARSIIMQRNLEMQAKSPTAFIYQDVQKQQEASRIASEIEEQKIKEEESRKKIEDASGWLRTYPKGDLLLANDDERDTEIETLRERYNMSEEEAIAAMENNDKKLFNIKGEQTANEIKEDIYNRLSAKKTTTNWGQEAGIVPKEYRQITPYIKPTKEQVELEYMNMAKQEAVNDMDENDREAYQKNIELYDLIDANSKNPSQANTTKINILKAQIADLTNNPKMWYDPITGKNITKPTEAAKEYRENLNEAARQIAERTTEDKLVQMFQDSYAKYMYTKKLYNTNQKFLASAIGSGDESINLDIKQAERLKDLYIKAKSEFEAVSKAYLLNRDPAGVEKTFGSLEQFFKFTGEKVAKELIPSVFTPEGVLTGTNEQFVRNIENLANDYNIELTEDQEDRFKHTFGENVTEGVVGLVGLLPKLWLGNKVAGAVEAGLAIDKAIKIWSNGTKLEKGLAFVTKGVIEEVKMQGIGFEKGVGAGFYLAHGLKIPKLSGKYGAILQPFYEKILQSSIGGTAGMEAGEIVAAAVDALEYDQSFVDEMDKLFPNLSESTKRIAEELIINSVMGLPHLKRTDFIASPDKLIKAANEMYSKGYRAEADQIKKKADQIRGYEVDTNAEIDRRIGKGGVINTEQRPVDKEKPATVEGEVVLTKNTSPTSDKYGTINRNDGKGVVDLTKEEFEAEQAKMQPKVDEQVTPTAEGEQADKATTEFAETKFTPIPNPTVVITGLRNGFETLSSNNPPQEKPKDIGRGRSKDFDKDGILIDTDSEGNKTLYVKVDAADAFGRAGNITVQIKVPNGSEVNQVAIKKIIDEQVEKMKSNNNIDLRLDKISQSDFDGLKNAIVEEVEKPTIITNEKEPTKKEDGEPMSGGVQGVRTEGQEGKESAELRPEEEEEVKPTPQKIKVLGKDVNMYNDYIPSKVEDVETDAMYTFSANSKDGIPTLLQDVAYSNKKEVNGVKTENWYASISGDELIKLYPKKEVTEQEITTTEGKPKEATPTAEEKVAVEGSTVTLPPAIKGGMERTMVFKDGEWQQQVGGTPTKVGDKLKTQADEAFKASQKPKVVGEKVEVKNAPKGNHLNIGLLEGRTNERMSSEDVLSKLPKDVKVISFSEVEGTEPTLSVETSRPLTDAEMTKLLEDTKQQAIPQLTEGIGVLYDAKRGTPESWGEFNPEYFVTQKGENLKQYASKEEVAETAKTEKTKEDVKQETKEKIFTYDKDGNIVEAEVLSKGKDTTSILLNGKQTVRANTEVFADRESAQKRIDSEVESDGLTEEDKEDLKRIDSDIYASENNIEDFKNEIETEKGNLKEEKERIKQEKAKVRASSMSKKAKAEKLEELDAELEDIINDHDDLVQQYRDDIAQEKQDIKRYKKEKAKLEQKAAKAKVPAVKKITTAAKKILDNLKPSKIFAGRDSQVSLASDDYKEQNGMSTNTPNMIFAVSEADGKRIADAYDQMKHDPDNPTVKQAFNELITEIKKQADALIARGYKFQIAKEGEGYNSDSQKMFEDVRKNKRIFVDPSSKSFGTKRTFDSENIGLQDSGYKDVNGVPMTNVELIRAVHDLFGHNEFGNGFGAIGEENAWRNHMSMFTPLAQRALTATTRGQNSWVNFGKHMRNPDGSIKKKGDSGYLSPSERPFAEQKIGLLPEWATENAYGDTVTINGKKIKPVNKYVVDGAEIYEIEDAQAFYEAAKAGKESDKQAGIQVELKSVEKIQEILDKGGRLLISKDGKVGMILESNGNAGSGFKNATAEGKNLLKPLLLTAIKLGARYTDAYDTFLPEYYSKFGFKPYKRIKFNPEFAEQGWEDTILKSKPDIVVMYWDGGSRENIEKNYGKFPEYSKTQGEYTTDYEGAINEARDISNSKESESSLIPNKTAKPEAGKEGEQITTKDAVQEPSTEKEVPRTGKAGEDLTEGGEGVGQSKQGEEAPQKSEKEVIQEYVDMYDSMREDDVTAMEKREMSEKMKRMLDENPKIKRIFDNIKNINKSLEAQGLITKTKGCP